MVRQNTRKKRGGESQLMTDFRSKLDKVEEELKDLKKTLSSLENNNSNSEIITSDNIVEEKINNSKPEDITDVEIISEEPKLESSKSSILQKNISLDGYNGPVSDIVSKIRGKINQLNKPVNKGRYDDKIKEYQTIISNIQTADNIDQVKSATQYKLVFKNNNLMGGKTKKNGKKRRNKSSKNKNN